MVLFLGLVMYFIIVDIDNCDIVFLLSVFVFNEFRDFMCLDFYLCMYYFGGYE